MKQFLIDTNIIIYYLNNSLPEEVKNKLNDIFKISFNISVITKMELLGFKQHTEESFNTTKIFLSNANIVLIDDQIVDKVIELKRKYLIKLADSIICASALLNNYTLITRNINDFKNTGLKIYNPLEKI